MEKPSPGSISNESISEMSRTGGPMLAGQSVSRYAAPGRQPVALEFTGP